MVVWKVIEESRTLHWMLPSLNATFIALIPKEEHAMTPDKLKLLKSVQKEMLVESATR